MFPIPNTSISFQTYDADAGRTPAAQTFVANQLLTGGYVYCSTAAVFVRLTVGPQGQQRQLPEFFLSPGSQGVSVDSRSGGNPVSKIEVRAATGTAAQFWGALSTDTDPVGPFYPASYSVAADGSLVPPPAIALTFEQDGAVKSFRQIADFISVGGVAWNISDDVPNTRALIQVPPIGVQVADAGQLNEQIIDFQNAGGITWTIADDAVNHRVKITGTVAAASNFIARQTYVADVTVAATAPPGTQVVQLPSTVYQNKLIRVIFFAASVRRAVAGATPNPVKLVLQRDAVTLADYWVQGVQAASQVAAFPSPIGIFFDTPTAGSHTYTVSAYASVANEWIVSGGPGGAAQIAPGFIYTEYV